MRTEGGSWAFPERLQPRQDRLHFDLESALSSVVLVRAEEPVRLGVLAGEKQFGVAHRSRSYPYSDSRSRRMPATGIDTQSGRLLSS